MEEVTPGVGCALPRFLISSLSPISRTMTCTFWIVIALLINGSFGLNVLDGLKTGVVYQFELTTQTQLTNRDQIKTVDEQESSAAIFAQLLHWDQDSQKRVLVIWVSIRGTSGSGHGTKAVLFRPTIASTPFVRGVKTEIHRHHL